MFRRTVQGCWLPPPFASFLLTSPPVRHSVPSGSERPIPTGIMVGSVTNTEGPSTQDNEMLVTFMTTATISRPHERTILLTRPLKLRLFLQRVRGKLYNDIVPATECM